MRRVAILSDAVNTMSFSRMYGPAFWASLLIMVESKEDPLIPFDQWQLDNPCPVPLLNMMPPLSECKLDSFPAYVVNASTVRDVQLAVNFARNNYIRLTIKYVSVGSLYV
jgi:hypothetical protein